MYKQKIILREVKEKKRRFTIKDLCRRAIDDKPKEEALLSQLETWDKMNVHSSDAQAR